MITRGAFIELALRQIYGSQPSDDSALTFNQVNAYLNQAIGYAAKSNYVDAVKLDGVAYLNNSFYTTFSGLDITESDLYTYAIELPQLPIGIGQNEGLASLKIQAVPASGGTGKSQDCIPMTINQVGINANRRPIPGKLQYWYEGNTAYVVTTGQDLSIGFKAIARMASGGDSDDLDSVLNVPDDYHSLMVEYLKSQLGFATSRMPDSQNDGVDNK